MSTPFKPLEIPPGVVTLATKKQRSSNWAEVNLVRWREGQLMPMGGQAQLSNIVSGVEKYVFASRCKAIHGWFGLDGVYRIAYLCEQNLYVDVGGALFDISPAIGIIGPIGLVGGYGDGLYNDSTYGTPRSISSVIEAHKIPDAFSLDNFGSILYAMTSADSRLLMWNPSIGPPGHAATVNTTAAFTLGTTTTINMVSNPGNVTPGMSVYNTTPLGFVGFVSSWATTSPFTLTLSSVASSTGTSGSALTFGNIAISQQAAAGRGPVPRGRCFVVTQERFIMIFGATQDGTVDGGSSRRFAWCDQENPGAWDYTNVVSQAGFLDVEPASPIICALASRVGVIFWTGKKVYQSRFLGSPYIYNYVELADGTTPWSPQSMITTSSLSLWMSEQGVFSYDGTSVLPVQCKIRSWVDDDFDPIVVRELACACHVSDFNEWWWFFPQAGQSSNTRAIIYNYKEGWWAQARMSRSAGFTSSYTSPPIFADGLVAFQHEVGNTYANALTPVALPFAETFDLNINSGSTLTTVKQMMPDVEGDITNLLYSIFYRRSRSLGDPELQSVRRPVRSDGYVDFRQTGRDVRLRIDVASPIVQTFTVGQHLIDAVSRGDR